MYKMTLTNNHVNFVLACVKKLPKSEQSNVNYTSLIKKINLLLFVQSKIPKAQQITLNRKQTILIKQAINTMPDDKQKTYLLNEISIIEKTWDDRIEEEIFIRDNKEQHMANILNYTSEEKIIKNPPEEAEHGPPAITIQTNESNNI